MNSDWEREQALVKKMIEHKVFFTAGQELTAEEPGYFRVIFSNDERTIRTGFKRLFEVIGKKEVSVGTPKLRQWPYHTLTCPNHS